jgi:hypothetical protein
VSKTAHDLITLGLPNSTFLPAKTRNDKERSGEEVALYMKREKRSSEQM